MSVRVVRLGTPRAPSEGTRIGTVRRPPRGVPKAKFAEQDWYDVWFPTLAPSVETMQQGRAAATPAERPVRPAGSTEPRAMPIPTPIPAATPIQYQEPIPRPV